jgi:hypothetical protein
MLINNKKKQRYQVTNLRTNILFTAKSYQITELTADNILKSSPIIMMYVARLEVTKCSDRIQIIIMITREQK